MFIIMILSKIILNIMTFSIMATLNIMTFSARKFRKMTFSIMVYS
jgi:hypothetical protein